MVGAICTGSKWLAHRHDCAVIATRIMYKFAVREAAWAQKPDLGPIHSCCALLT